MRPPRLQPPLGAGPLLAAAEPLAAHVGRAGISRGAGGLAIHPHRARLHAARAASGGLHVLRPLSGPALPAAIAGSHNHSLVGFAAPALLSCARTLQFLLCSFAPVAEQAPGGRAPLRNECRDWDGLPCSALCHGGGAGPLRARGLGIRLAGTGHRCHAGSSACRASRSPGGGHAAERGGSAGRVLRRRCCHQPLVERAGPGLWPPPRQRGLAAAPLRASGPAGGALQAHWR
mmetsp:Transcript_60576/g.189748  ORF Transcript_60576/g.189748 Transcript_60576/m.189748 type:complete len:232 (+) Transcript_60576:1163-1858(+)